MSVDTLRKVVRTQSRRRELVATLVALAQDPEAVAQLREASTDEEWRRICVLAQMIRAAR